MLACYGPRTTDNPCVMLCCPSAQKLAALRYQTWYSRVAPLLGTPPAVCTSGSPVSPPVAELGPGIAGRSRAVQAVFLDTQGLGWVSGPGVMTLLDAGI
jgi:hypothetical protein